MRVNLYGPDGDHTRKIQTETQQTNGKKSTNPTADVHRRASFAWMSKLKPQLKRYGLSDDNVWEYIKDFYNVESRAHLSAIEWATISARLRAAYEEPKLLSNLVSKIK